MASDAINALLAKPLNAIVGINRRKGGPQLTVVWFHWDGETFTFTTTRDRAKYANLKRDPHISILVDDPAVDKYVTAYGKAEIVEDGDFELRRPIIEKYVTGEHVEQFRTGPSAQNRILIALRPDKLVTNA